MTSALTPEWIAVDWGTSNLRVWAMQGGTVLAEAQSDKGMGKLLPAEFEPALIDLIGGWLARPVTAVACGMVGARQGWVEAPYAAAPCPATPKGFTKAPTATLNLTVQIVPGVSQDKPADVMRGEETQIAGFLARNLGWDGILCLPGTHTKWAQVSAAEIVSFQTVMTGDLFAAISGHTVLRHSVQTDVVDPASFAAGVSEALSRPERLAARLFSIRAEGLLHGMQPPAAKSLLSGLLIGAELAATRPYWLGQQVAIIGTGSLSRLYKTALALQGVPAQETDNDGITLAGLTAAWMQLKGSS